MKLRVVRSAPELHVALFAFLLNLPWEFLQVPLYVGMPTMPHWCHFQQLLRLNNNYCDNLYVEF